MKWLYRLRPRTLFGRTLITIAGVSLIFQLFTLAVIGELMLVPLGKRSAGDLAAIMVHAVETWVDTPAAWRPDFEEEMLHNHRLVMYEVDKPLPESHNKLPYLLFLQEALRERTRTPLHLKVSEDERGGEWYWADIDEDEYQLRIGFPRSRIGAEPPIAIFLVMSVGILVILATAILLAQRLTFPLERLAQVARRVGTGRWPEPVPEQGPEELAALSHSFNQMTRQVQDLLVNRTTLLAGISHDLRTPLARLQLAMAMLPKEADGQLIEGMQRDLDEMNRLIGEFLEISRGLDASQKKKVEIDIGQTLDDLVDNARRGGAEVEWDGGEACRRTVHRLAFKRIVSNLLDNAVRYGEGRPVRLSYSCKPGRPLQIWVFDRGPGIPEYQREAVFRPFYRLEQSRSASTGGSGLGLAIARQLAQMNGWSIELREREGGGTMAEVSIPEAETQAASC